MSKSLFEPITCLRSAADELCFLQESIVALDLVVALLETEVFASIDITKASKVSACLSIVEMIRADIENHADEVRAYLNKASEHLESWKEE